LLLFDIDDFHEVNNALGSAGGDALLVEIADRLQDRAIDSHVGRLGEDEFGVLLPTGDPKAIAACARELRQAFTQPLTVNGIQLAVEPRLGVAVIPDHGPDADQVLRRASVALSAAKEDKLDLKVFEPSLDSSDRSRMELVAELRHALSAGELVVHYQPQGDLATRAIRGMEALVRWQHPRLGLLPPDTFIPLAERSALITEIDHWVLQRAMTDWDVLRDRGIVIDLAVNLSPVDLLDARFAEHVGDLLESHGAPPEHLVLEITERTLLRDERRSHDGLDRLAATGARLSIDDFGTGYSSLAYLYKLPIRQVKLDRTFISNVPNDASSDAIIRATVDLAHTLNATVVAEGVETADQWNHLANLRCDTAQGFFVGVPQPAEALIELLTQPGRRALVAA
jgi:diguanylate cyclase (GGDEF)-like protein